MFWENPYLRPPIFLTSCIEVDDDYEECFSSGDEIEICHSDEHKWSSDVCMICKFCGYCTGYGPGCCNQGMGERDPGG